MLILSCYALCVCIFIHIDMYVYAKYFGNTTSNSVYNMRFYYYTYYTVKKLKTSWKPKVLLDLRQEIKIVPQGLNTICVI